MIVKMKKVFVMCMDEDRDQALDALRELGVLHVTQEKEPSGRNLDEARDRTHRATRAMNLLRTVIADLPSVDPADPAEDFDVDKAFENILDLSEKRARYEDTLKELRGELERVRPFGDFDPADVNALADRGIAVRFFELLGEDVPEWPENVTVEEFHNDGKKSYVAVIGAPEAVASNAITAKEFPMPEMSTAQLKAWEAELIQSIAQCVEAIQAVAPHAEIIEKRLADYENDQRFLEVKLGMGENGKIGYVSGYCPEPFICNVEDKAALKGWGLVIREPEPEEQPPTLIHYPFWVRPIKAVFDVLEIFPGYREADISIAFLFFFSLFFAMLIGDAGYGLIFLGLTIGARAVMRKAPHYPFTLLGALSLCTVAWGVLSGNYFGVTPETFAETAPPGWLAFLFQFQVEWLTVQENAMGLCFLIGAIHLTLAHAWNAIVCFPQLYAYAQIGWACMTWTMYCVACKMVLGYEIPVSLMVGLFSVGFILIVLFMTPAREIKREWIRHAMLPLSFISNFVDIVSYVRLFAVSMASLAVARSFNDMAMNIGFDGFWVGLITALILFLGHTLNIVLCALGVLVHGVRLNTLEFSLHKEMQWSGLPYQPFKRR